MASSTDINQHQSNGDFGYQPTTNSPQRSGSRKNARIDPEEPCIESVKSVSNMVSDVKGIDRTKLPADDKLADCVSPEYTNKSSPNSPIIMHTNHATLAQLEATQLSSLQESPFRFDSPLVSPSGSDLAHFPLEDAESKLDEERGAQDHQNYGMLSGDRETSICMEGGDAEVANETIEKHRRSPSGASTRTFQPSLFNDFDGAYCPSIVEDAEETEEIDDFDTYGDTSRHTWAEPPPKDSMVYYPAPVPKTLNLPQKLSFVPSATTQMKRRTQVLESVPAQARQSAMWLPEGTSRDSLAPDGVPNSVTDKRMSSRGPKRASVLPAHLRASAFFERPSVPQELKVKDESAVTALEDFLNASASTPADAFTDHPIVGNVLRDVYAKDLAKDHLRNSTYSALNPDQSDARKSKNVIAGSRLSMQKFRRLRGRSSSRTDLERHRRTVNLEGGDSNKGNISHDERAAMDLATNVDAKKHGYDQEADPGGNEDDEVQDGHEHEEYEEYEQEKEDEDEDEEEGKEEEEEGDDDDDSEDGEEKADDDLRGYGPPTTLLAELQIRKAELKQRNRTAVQAFPNGMHATLLELDAVAQIEKKRRKGRRTALAWEDPTEIAAGAEIGGDDEIPLGVLFPPKNALVNRFGGDDWDRPLGLIEKKHRDDNEPLSSRRNRLRGISPNKIPCHPSVESQDQDIEENSEHEGETLAERTRRLKTLDALDSAIRKSRPASAEFATEMMSQFGIPEKPTVNEAELDLKASLEEAEETLGQRRRRIQAEEQARQLANGYSQQGKSLPGSTMSYANLLAAYPTGTALLHSNDVAPQTGFVGRQGGLLSLNEQHQAQQRQELMQHNLGIISPSSDNGEEINNTPSFSGLLGQENPVRARLRREISLQKTGIRQVPAESQEHYISMNGFLGFHDQQRAYQREQLFEQSKRNTSMLTVDPSVAQPRTGYASGRFNDDTGGVAIPAPAYDSLQQRMFYNNMNMRSPSGNPVSGAFYASGYSQTYQPAMQAQYGMPIMYPGYCPPVMQETIPFMEGPPLDQKQREAIENWRQSVM